MYIFHAYLLHMYLTFFTIFPDSWKVVNNIHVVLHFFFKDLKMLVYYKYKQIN
jgi:hypothetical protein